jgi:hypothetical protein
MTGPSQGKAIQLNGIPPVPTTSYLNTGVEFVSFPPMLDSLVDQFVAGLRNEPQFLEDTQYHDDCIRQLNHNIFQRVCTITPQELKQVIQNYVMMKPPNRNSVFSEIDSDFPKIKRFLAFLAEFSGDPVKNINDLCNNSSFKIRGSGIFFITQLLAAAHPDKYVVLEDNISRSLRHLGIIDVLVQNDTGNGYIYINEISKKLYNDKLKNKLGVCRTYSMLFNQSIVRQTQTTY